ncbi:MAG: nucleoside 2-deoxyribosyltransferase [Methyloligellaceae bacterium]
MSTYQKRIYLAGPDVFYPNAKDIGERKKDMCAQYGFSGVFPLDGEAGIEEQASPFDKARGIYLHLEKMMDECDLVIANLTPFRSVSMDVGTAFEAGYMKAQGKPVLGYTNVVLNYAERMEHYYKCTSENRFDADFLRNTDVEAFDLSENLMIEIAITEAGSQVVKHSSEPGSEQADLAGFEQCLQEAVKICRNE